MARDSKYSGMEAVEPVNVDNDGKERFFVRLRAGLYFSSAAVPRRKQIHEAALCAFMED